MKKIKSIWVRFLVTALSIAMIIGCFGGIVLAEEDEPASPTDFTALHQVGDIQSKVKLGEEINVPKAEEGVTVTVKTPNGEVMSPANGKYIAAAVGNYIIEYKVTEGEASYRYVINCYEENEYFIYVANGGATIPTYISSGKSFTLPDWYLAYTDEDGELVKAEAVVTKVTLNNTEVQPNGGKYNISFKAGETETYTLTLAAGFNEDKMYKTQYTINVQNNFEDTKSPTLRNISNMPSSASLKTKVDLPKASADDDYDENVLILVEVTDPSGNPVKKVETNDQDYAVKETDETLVFDNDRVMSFYPMNNGTYTVTYMAVDDANASEANLADKGNNSAKHEYRITVSDKTGPVITEIDDSRIPNVWGLESVKAADNKDVPNVLYLPLPEVVDNNGTFSITKGENGNFVGTGDVNLTIEIRNPNDTVAKFDKLSAETIAKGESKIDSTNSTYGEYFKDKKDGEDYSVAIVKHGDEIALKLDFGAFYKDSTTASKTKAGIVGTWTVTYSVRDAAGNGGYNASQKSYSINVKELSFVDSNAPEVEAPTLNDYIMIGGDETEYTVPNIIASDDNDARLDEQYFLVCGGKQLAVKGGEKLDIVEKDGKWYFENEDEESLEITGDKLEFAYTAKDDAGNETKLVMPKDNDDDEEADDVNYSINIYMVTEAGFGKDAIKFEFNDKEPLQAGTSEEQELGSFEVGGIKQPEFVGFEMALVDGNGDPVKTSAYMYFTEEEENTVLHVENMTCKPAKAGTYILTIRVLDAKGNSVAYAKTFEVVKEDDLTELNGKNATVAWETNSSVGTSYSLKKEKTIVKGDGNIGVYKLEGGKYSILGYNFTPLASGSYTITECHGKVSEFDTEENGFDADKLTVDSIYGMTATDSQSVTYDVIGVLPTYIDNENYTRPQDTNTYQDPEVVDGKTVNYFYVTAPFIAYSENVNYDIELTYTKPGGNNSTNKANKIYEHEADGKTVYSFDKKSGDFHGRFALVLDEDGTYTLTVKAVGVNDSGKTYTIKVGDTTKPQFELDATKQDRRVGDLFEYKEFKYIASEGESESEIRVSYRLIEPGNDGAEVTLVSASNKTLSSLKSSGSDTIKIETSEYRFSKSGNYTVEIELTDAAGNSNVLKYTISVNSTASSTPTSLTMLSTVLIIVGVLLILGVIVYLIRFRKRRA